MDSTSKETPRRPFKVGSEKQGSADKTNKDHIDNEPASDDLMKTGKESEDEKKGTA